MARIKPNYNLCTSMIACDGADIPPRMTVCSACQEKQAQRKVIEAREAKANQITAKLIKES